jgi:hypothetical protein
VAGHDAVAAELSLRELTPASQHVRRQDRAAAACLPFIFTAKKSLRPGLDWISVVATCDARKRCGSNVDF